ncbi:hypothetical protein KEM48_006489 [Puccinia striiformis f. sp. tritici PST-130]|nr:hypothetical protein KEM48_006489 [Puccinia striiformis f. sp. tritici PST-130]
MYLVETSGTTAPATDSGSRDLVQLAKLTAGTGPSASLAYSVTSYRYMRHRLDWAPSYDGGSRYSSHGSSYDTIPYGRVSKENGEGILKVPQPDLRENRFKKGESIFGKITQEFKGWNFLWSTFTAPKAMNDN